MAELKTSLERLTTLATRLNSETDEVNVLIADVERKLGKLNLGVAVWLEHANGWPILLEETGSQPTFGEQLGFSEIKGRWRIAVRNAFASNRTDDEGESYVELRTVGEPKPLLEASRIARVEACAHLVALVEELATKVEGFLDNLEAAKKAVKP